MSNATPGPWHCYPMPTKTAAEAAANRALALAAPDLLVAGQRTFDSIESLIFTLEHNAPGAFSQAEIIDKLRWLIGHEGPLRSALAKATGGQ